MAVVIARRACFAMVCHHHPRRRLGLLWCPCTWLGGRIWLARGLTDGRKISSRLSHRQLCYTLLATETISSPLLVISEQRALLPAIPLHPCFFSAAPTGAKSGAIARTGNGCRTWLVSLVAVSLNYLTLAAVTSCLARSSSRASAD